ncbi:MAG: hypothetical protein IID38_01380 [Planctomycetes bacterium]|nr:hypothetical protein [Planctomycetota bacterium]
MQGAAHIDGPQSNVRRRPGQPVADQEDRSVAGARAPPYDGFVQRSRAAIALNREADNV